MPALLELQRAFGAALRDRPHAADDWAVGDAIAAAARLRVYRNNSQTTFEQALQSTYPVVERRVGSDYFRQLAHQYRDAQPSGAGDLHEVGRHFPAFLAAQLGGGPYAWLAELAMLEWAVAEAGIAADSPVAAAASLGGLPPDALVATRLRLVPSLRRVAGSVPVLSVWRANQSGVDGAAVDLDSGAEFVVVHRASGGVQLRALSPVEFGFVGALERAAPLGAAVDASGLPLESLPGVLHWLFLDEAVAAVVAPQGA